MKSLSEFTSSKISILFTDIDDTLTNEGQLGAPAYQALWRLHENGFRVIPVTGRPAGWCEMIARLWPVDGVIGENGGFYFRLTHKTMKRHFVQTPEEQKTNREKLQQIESEILKTVPGSAIASDQFTRLLDLAVDFCEDVPALSEADIQKIVSIFQQHGAQAKVSSIHVNGWFGTFNKLSMCRTFLSKEYGLDLDQARDTISFVGDSPNDEPMFGYFPLSFAVANVKRFKLESWPTFVASGEGGCGFVEIAEKLIALKT